MAIGPIGPVGPIAVPALGSTAPATGANPTGGADFASALGRGLDNLQSTQAKADDLAVKAATGSLTDVHEYMIAATEASLTTQLTVAVRNKALDAFNDIMRMQA
jgi:flagellar hook-basal body complex protein FliE